MKPDMSSLVSTCLIDQIREHVRYLHYSFRKPLHNASRSVISRARPACAFVFALNGQLLIVKNAVQPKPIRCARSRQRYAMDREKQVGRRV